MVQTSPQPHYGYGVNPSYSYGGNPSYGGQISYVGHLAYGGHPLYGGQSIYGGYPPCGGHSPFGGNGPYSRYPAPYGGHQQGLVLKDYGPAPFVIDIERATSQNRTFRTALWTGKYLQLTLMSIGVGEDIGLEVHEDHDQFIRIEDGHGLILMGDRPERLSFQANVTDDDVILIPAGTWHNLLNTGNKPLKLYSIYAPPEHPHGTVHQTKADQ